MHNIGSGLRHTKKSANCIIGSTNRKQINHCIFCYFSDKGLSIPSASKKQMLLKFFILAFHSPGIIYTHAASGSAKAEMQQSEA